jgi:hypothetical protein
MCCLRASHTGMVTPVSNLRDFLAGHSRKTGVGDFVRHQT